jgi:transposase
MFLPGQSVARVAQAECVNSHQVFDWRRAYRRGELTDTGERSSALLPVVMAAASGDSLSERHPTVKPEAQRLSGVIHIELPGRASISVGIGADATLLHSILTTLASNDRSQGDPALERLRK